MDAHWGLGAIVQMWKKIKKGVAVSRYYKAKAHLVSRESRDMSNSPRLALCRSCVCAEALRTLRCGVRAVYQSED